VTATTRLVLLERALKESEQRYGSLVNSLDAGFCTVEILYDAAGIANDYRFIEVNHAFKELTGLEDAVGKTIYELTPDHDKSWVELYAQVARTQESVRFDSPAATSGDRWYEVNAFPVGASPHRVAIIFNEISAKRRAEDTLRVNETRLDHALSIASLGTFEWNIPQERMSLSKRGEAIFGFSTDEQPDSTAILARIEPKDYARLQIEAQDSLKTGVRRSTEYQVLLPDGSVRLVRSVSDVANGAGPANRFIGVLEDITQSRNSDSKLQELNAALLKTAAENITIHEALYDEKERAQVTLNSIGDAVICTNVEGQVTYLNAVAERLTGWKLKEANGKALELVFHLIDSNTREAIANPMALATAENKTVGLPPQCTLVRRDGSELAIEDSAAPIHDRTGKTTGAVMVFHDVSAARDLSLQLSHQAQHDPLTDLPNRSLLNDRLAQAIALTARHDARLAVLYLDIDRFKNINDSLGHLIGDRLLITVGERLLACVRASDTVSRQGGDEFVILLAEVNTATDAGLCAEKILARVRMPYNLDGHELHVSASIGIVICPEDGTAVETLLKNADSAMYEAKDRGRDNFQFYRKDLNASAQERQVTEGELRHALDRGQLRLHYQPILHIASGLVAGIEALIRWEHPTRGMLAPVSFMQIAEESGLIVPIGNWVLKEACRQGAVWHAAGFIPLRLAVNISAVELRSKDFVQTVAKTLAETGFDAHSLELELTETFLMQDAKSTSRVLEELKALGLDLALDDFGTGYSSLSYMRRFPINALKIDRSFVNDLTLDQNDASVVSAVINMGKSLHMRVVAEGVETSEQLDFLREQACPEAQGYFFSRPLIAEGFGQGVQSGSLRLGSGVARSA
jgi:diguanylate cyclase (GGDEF)-like protein/PAS domain S-box-containing protein